MSLPEAVQRQVDAADNIVNAMNGAAPVVPDTQQNETQPVVQQESVVAVPQQVTDATWEARYQTINGKYAAEVPRLAHQVREQQSALNTLLAENEALKRYQSTASTPQNQQITDADKEVYGADMVSMVERVADAKAAKVMAEADRIRAENEQLKRQMAEVQGHVAVSANDRFVQQLTAAIPDWRSVNADAGFLRWLGETDPIYGLPRQAGLDQASNALDAARVARIFESYRGAAVPQRNPQQELQSQIAPTSSRGSVAPTQGSAQGRYWSEAEIAEFYTQARRGDISHEDASRIENEIDIAVAEGRVR